MRKLVTFSLLVLLGSTVLCQTPGRNITGQISFVTSQNVYVRFSSTKGINVNDTLYISSGEKLTPVLIVNNLSSTSCLCTPVSTEELPQGHIIIAKTKESGQDEKQATDSVSTRIELTPVTNESDSVTVRISPGPDIVPSLRRQNIQGSLSASSYTYSSNTDGPDLQNFRYTFSLDARNIGNSKLSAESYISFRHRTGQSKEIKQSIFNALKIYSLALKYDPDSTIHLSLGRQINPRISSIGSFDGLTAEKSIRNFTLGAIGGSRPDYLNYGFNPKLLQYGVFLSHDILNDKGYSGTSLAYIEQLFSGRTDRRFLYLQHSGSLVKNLSFFSSFEVDLFKLENSKAVSAFDLTSLFMSLNYRLSKSLAISGSYDTRKNPVYFETYKTFLDSLVANNIRQSFRLSSTIRLNNSLLLGVQSSWRYLKTDLRQSKNISGFLTYSHSGNNYLSATLNGNYIETSYITGYNAGLTFMNNPAKGKIQTGLGYNYQDYKLIEGNLDIIQHTGKANFLWHPSVKLSFSLDYEIIFESKDIYNRLYLQVIRRF